ncbi:MAG: NAD(P)-dependent oxidoreductase [Gaiellales bacterium]
MRVLVAGASGAIGSSLLPQLIERGHDVVATTRSPEKLERLRELGARPVLMDGLDAGSVGEVVARAEPEVVIHQMTALRGLGNLRRFDDQFAVTNELRGQGTEHLLTAAEAVGVRRFIAASFTGWPNARTGDPVKSEEDPLDPSPPAHQRRSMAALQRLERLVTCAESLTGIALRYGSFYGPGTSMATEYAQLIRKRKLPIVGGGGGIWSFIQIDDAAAATVAAVERGDAGIYNIVDDEPAPVSEWLPYLAECLGAKPPRHVPVWLVRPMIGEVGVSIMTRIHGASNAKARRELDWEPTWRSWRDGFRHALLEPPAEEDARLATGGRR